MTALFCHDHRFIVAEDGRVYSSGQYDRHTVERYEAVFGSLTIAGRCRLLAPGEDISELSLVFDDPERFIGLPNLSSLKGLFFAGRSAKARLHDAVGAADLVIARLPSEIGLAGIDVAQSLGKPTLVEVVACISDGLRYHGTWEARLYAPLANRRMARAVRGASHVVYVTETFLQSRYPTLGRSSGVSDVFLPPPDPRVVQARLDQIERTPSATIFGMVAARFHKGKGLDVAIRALAEARRQDATLRLKVLGPGEPTPWLDCARRAGVADFVEFSGAASKGEPVLRWIDDIDVYVQASFQEGLSRALLEAMSRGTPALASATGGTAELIPEEWMHVPGDHSRLAEQMLAIRPASLRRQLASRNFARSADYAADALDQQRADFWRSAIDTPAVDRGSGAP